jgi:hypothetical protein
VYALRKIGRLKGVVTSLKSPAFVMLVYIFFLAVKGVIISRHIKKNGRRMMRKINASILFLMVVALLFMGCKAGEQIKVSDTAQHKVMAYAAGNGVGVGVAKLIPAADQELQDAFDKMMDRNRDRTEIPSQEMIDYFSESVLILGRHTDDPHLLIQHLSVLLMIFGAEYDVSGNMTGIDPVPKTVVVFFGMGYDSGMAMVAKEKMASWLYGKPWIAMR